MLKSYPIKFDTIEIPFPNSMGVSNEVLENVNETEAGTDITQIRRIEKLTISMSFRLMDRYLALFETFAYSTSTIQVSMYNATAGTYIMKDMRMRDFQYKLVESSEKVQDINGMYDISFKLVEM